jgi:hypothetical protein
MESEEASPFDRLSLALIGNAWAGHFEFEKEKRPEAFSMRRLAGTTGVRGMMHGQILTLRS